MIIWFNRKNLFRLKRKHGVWFLSWQSWCGQYGSITTVYSLKSLVKAIKKTQ